MEENISIRFKYELDSLISCIDNTLSNIEKDLSGLYDNYKISKDLFLYIKNNNSFVKVDLKHVQLNLPDMYEYFIFNGKNTNKFLLFYTSSVYKGKLNLLFDKTFVNELNNNLKEIFVEVESTDVYITPSFLENEKTFLFKCKHPLLNNIYFSIVRYSSNSYKFFFMFDVFSYKNVIEKNLNLVSKKLESIKSDLSKFKEKYNQDILKDAVYLKEFQSKILKEKENLEKTLNKVLDAISLLDSIFTDIENIDFSFNKFKKVDISFLDKIKFLKKYEEFMDYYDKIYELALKIESLKKENEIALEEMEHKLESITESIKVVEQRIKQEKENIENKKQNLINKISKIDEILSKNIWNYNDLSEFSKEIPRIQNYIIIKERIDDIKKIINSEKGIKGKIKRFLSNYDKELSLEEKKLEKEIKNIEVELRKLKDKYKEEINNIDISTLDSLESQINSYIKELKSVELSFENKMQKLFNLFKDYIKDLKNILDRTYENLHKTYSVKKRKKLEEIENLISNYNKYFNEVKNKYNYNLIKIYDSIQNLYESGICEKSYLPKDLQDFKEYFSKEKDEITDLLNFDKSYNKNIKDNLREIVNIIKDITFHESPAFALIKDIEEKLINDLKLII